MAMGDEDPRMWDYWCNKYGHDEALRLYYQNILSATPELRVWLQQQLAAQQAIDAHMAKLAAEAERANPGGNASDWWTK